MNTNIDTFSLEIGQIGSLNLNIPVTKIGAGKPHLAILCGMHGDEKASLIISQLYLNELMQKKSINGSVSIVTAANPFAMATRSRVTIPDYEDLNRKGIGNRDGTLTERLAHSLFDYLSDCSFVIDVHELDMNTLTMAIFIESKIRDIEQINLEAISAFKPAIVWAISNTTSGNSKYSTALLTSLLNNGIPGFAFETLSIHKLTRKDITEIVRGLIEVAKLLGIVPGKPRITFPPVYNRHINYANKSGIWIPKLKLMEKVKKNEKVGDLISLNFITHDEIFISESGTLIQLREQDIIGITVCT